MLYSAFIRKLHSDIEPIFVMLDTTGNPFGSLLTEKLWREHFPQSKLSFDYIHDTVRFVDGD